MIREIIYSLLFLGLLAVLWLEMAAHIERKKNRHLNPKDYGYRAYSQFGKSLGLPPIERVSKRVKWAPASEIAAWINDYEKVDQLVDMLAAQGGSKKLGPQTVESKLREEFPFLQYEGLRSAISLVDYMVWHEGY